MLPYMYTHTHTHTHTARGLEYCVEADDSNHCTACIFGSEFYEEEAECLTGTVESHSRPIFSITNYDVVGFAAKQ